MAKRLAHDDAITQLAQGIPGAVNLTEDLPVYCRERQEQHFIRQAPDVEMYLCGIRDRIKRIKAARSDMTAF